VRRFLLVTENSGSASYPSYTAKLLALTPATRIVDVTAEGELVDVTRSDAGRLARVRSFEYDAGVSDQGQPIQQSDQDIRYLDDSVRKECARSPRRSRHIRGKGDDIDN
jgi:hypothetical protein